MNTGRDIIENLNSIDILHDSSRLEQIDNSSNFGNVTIYFRNIKQALIEKINKYPVVVGCVAWLSDYEIIEVLSKKEVSIIVNKEDFLRPDYNKKGLKKTDYDKIKNHFDRPNFATSKTFPTGLSYCSDPTLQGVRCCGVFLNTKNRPRMHNKFLIFGEVIHTSLESDESGHVLDVLPERFIPKAIWTGSFNLSYTATMSFENCIFIENEEIAQKYFDEYIQILALSEPLNWNSNYVEPEYRFGS